MSLGKYREHRRVVSRPGGESATQQQHKAEADINVITSRYIRTGNVPHPGATGAMFGDFTSLDFLEMQNTIVDANNYFSRLPSRVRRRFDNDPYQMFRFMEDPENLEEAVKLGLLEKAPVKDPNQTALPLKDEKEKPPEAAVKADPEANPVPSKGGK